MNECTYHFRFADGEEATMSTTSLPGDAGTLPAWTRLTDHQCPNCPLAEAEVPQCPLALRLVPLMEATAHRQSIDGVEVDVHTPQRTYSKTTTVQSAAGSLMGLLSATSDCPHTLFLRGLAEFHLPFSNDRETLFRVVSSYLLVQYMLDQKGHQPDWELQYLKTHYTELAIVNRSMANRLRAASDKDGAVNALIILDSLGKSLKFSIEDALEEIQPVFEYYWKERESTPPRKE